MKIDKELIAKRIKLAIGGVHPVVIKNPKSIPGRRWYDATPSPNGGYELSFNQYSDAEQYASKNPGAKAWRGQGPSDAGVHDPKFDPKSIKAYTKELVARVKAKLGKAVKSPDPKLTAEQYKQIVEDNFISAIEGGSNYWYWIEQGKWNAGAHIWDGSMTISNKKMVEDEPKTKLVEKKIDEHSIAKGWDIFKQSHSKDYTDAINENGDASTGDVLLQCIVLGKVIYG